MAFDMIERDVLDPYVIEGAVWHALARLETMRDDGSRRPELTSELEVLEAELQRLTAAIAADEARSLRRDRGHSPRFSLWPGISTSSD